MLVAELARHGGAREDRQRGDPDDDRGRAELHAEPAHQPQDHERLHRAERQLEQRVGGEERAQRRIAAQQLEHLADALAGALGGGVLLGHALADDEYREQADRAADDHRGDDERRRLADREQQPAAEERQPRPDPAPDRLRALRAPRDLIADEVRVERAIGLVRDEVAREEHRDRQRQHGHRPDQAHPEQREHRDRRSRDDERAGPTTRRSAPAAGARRSPRRR